MGAPYERLRLRHCASLPRQAQIGQADRAGEIALGEPFVKPNTGS